MRGWIFVAGLASAVLPSAALQICGVEIPHARASPASRALDNMEWPESFPFTSADLTPEWAGNDGLFYFYPKFVQHAGDECRASLTRFYEEVLPRDGDALDICSSWTSHYPKSWSKRRSAVLGLNALELLANPTKTEWCVQNLNKDPTLPYDDASFDVVTNALSVDYLTQPLEVFAEMERVLRPGGLACAAFTNRCFPTKVVPIWTRPFTEDHHAQIVASYFKFSSDGWEDIGVADVSPDGWVGQRDPMVVVMARKASS